MGWFLCIPVFLLSLASAPGQLDPRVYAHLTTAFLISGLIAITHGFFILEIFSQRLLYPVFFRDFPPAKTPGARPLSLRSRGLLWFLSAGVCPIGSLLLLMLVPQDRSGVPWFAISVAGIGVAFGLTTAWLVGRWVTEPVEKLKIAAKAVAEGDLSIHIDLLRADDFGPLIDEFNQMIGGLRGKQHLQETFGRHVGRQTAQLILDRDPGLGGFEETVTVVFVDIRNFTSRCERSSPRQIVEVLNLFLAEMVDVVEKQGGIVNKFLGDGLMALFGVGVDGDRHADAAVTAGQEMLARLATLNRRLSQENREPLEIGIGIHTGPAIVGSIGSPRRMEFTAIGNTVNIAARVEGLTKSVNSPLLMTSATRDALHANVKIKALAPQPVKGQSKPLAVFQILVETPSRFLSTPTT
ncbi:MAG: adenylate/guanylate cyclase domain-containing protein [Planctomycetes bacterium]|nr:adenylate/guanylate cyclase domain-containing protein [Planctomycetota bacterium]